MRAWVFRTKGEPASSLKLEQDWSKPVPGKHQVLVKVHAAALNPVGWKMMSMAPLKYLTKVPAVPESDFSGVVEGGDLEGTGLQVGDAVFGIVPAESVMKTGRGVLAEYTLVEKHLLTKKPDNISFEGASSFPLTTSTAFWSMVKTSGLKKGAGQRVFINGGSGGVGVNAIQLAKAYGAYVVTTCSGPSRKLVESLGADEVIDYKEGDLIETLASKFSVKEKPFDMIFDTAGMNSELYHQSPRYLVKTGTFVDIAGPTAHTHSPGLLDMVQGGVELVNRTLRPAWLGGTPRRYVFGMFTPDEEWLKEIGLFVAEGKLKPIIDEVFPFEEAVRAYDRQKSGRAKGKVVVSVLQE
ncbi:hypothetical protein JCM10213_006090 [Rhodosporidiobolus nylandii]